MAVWAAAVEPGAHVNTQETKGRGSLMLLPRVAPVPLHQALLQSHTLGNLLTADPVLSRQARLLCLISLPEGYDGRSWTGTEGQCCHMYRLSINTCSSPTGGRAGTEEEGCQSKDADHGRE